MRNFRKTRKRGGLGFSVILECVGPIKAISKCEAEFLKQNNFMRIRIPGDGNCFYHALSKYYQLSKAPGAPKVPSHIELRERVVDTMENNIEEVIPSLLVNMSSIPNNAAPGDREVLEMAKYLEALDDLREDGVWNSDNADLVSQFAAKALNIRIKIFDKREPQEAYKRLAKKHNNGRKEYENMPSQPAKIVCYTFEPEDYVGLDTINLLRVGNGHYELLYPNDAPVAPKGRRATAKKANAAPDNNLVSNTAAKLAAVRLTNKKNNKKNAPSGYATRSKAKAAVANNLKSRRKSLENALKQIANLEKKEAEEAKKIAAKKKPVKKGVSRNRTNSLENALLKIALQESEEQKKKNTLSNRFFENLNNEDPS